MRILFFLMLLFALPAAHASLHECLCSDELFLSEGKKYPSVGYFVEDDEPNYGSGVLIDCKIPELTGKVVLTAAHVLYKKNEKSIFFNLAGFKGSGKAMIHPEYIKFMVAAEPYDPTYACYDIALFILDEFCESLQAQISFDFPVQALSEHDLIAVGYGMTGHAATTERISDCRRRGSSLTVQKELNRLGTGMVSLVCGTGELKKTIKYTRDNESVFHLTSSWVVSDAPCTKPYGSTSPGDSGGGLFHPESHNLVGIISVSTGYRVMTKEYVTSVYCEIFKEFYEKNALKALHAGVDLSKLVIADNEIDWIGLPNRCDLFGRSIRQISQVTSLAYHQDWLKQKFKEVALAISIQKSPNILE